MVYYVKIGNKVYSSDELEQQKQEEIARTNMIALQQKFNDEHTPSVHGFFKTWTSPEIWNWMGNNVKNGIVALKNKKIKKG